MSHNSVQSFVIENCNKPTIENGLNNVCLHPLSHTFTFTVLETFSLKKYSYLKVLGLGLKISRVHKYFDFYHTYNTYNRNFRRNLLKSSVKVNVDY